MRESSAKGLGYLEALLEGAEVKWKPLGEIGTFVRGNGLQKKNFTETGVPCIHYGQIYTYYGMFATETKSFVSEEAALKFRKAQQGDLIIATTSENVRDLCKTVVWLGKEEICISAHSAVFHHCQNSKYLAFYFQTPYFQRQKDRLAKGTTVMDISVKDLIKIEIPIPPLAVQERIVEILDKFTALEAELEARKKQYEYYRNRLLRFGKEVEWKPLGEVAELKRGTSITQLTSTEGCYPVISGGRQPAYYVDQFNRTGETITVAGSGAYAGFLQYWNEPIFVGDAFSIKPDPALLLPRFVYFFLLKKQAQLHAMKVGGAVPHVYTKHVAPILIPLPPLAIQQQIVDILDKFHTLVHSLTEGLPAEIALRRQQYEYYRNQLLRFPR